jgi:hypothetical protein
MNKARNGSGMGSLELDEITRLLLDASKEIHGDYFRLAVAGAASTIFRERVYCYELYHQWRAIWPENSCYSICGETDKRKHPFVRGLHLTDKIPDFLVHCPGLMTSSDNLIVMEVKSHGSSPASILEDLAKLTGFRRSLVDACNCPANYQAAFFWLYGTSSAAWVDVNARILKELNRKTGQPNAVEPKDVSFDLIRVFLHERPGEKAVEVEWRNT